MLSMYFEESMYHVIYIPLVIKSLLISNTFFLLKHLVPIYLNIPLSRFNKNLLEIDFIKSIDTITKNA